MKAETPTTFRLGEFTVETSLNRLTSADGVVHLEPKSMAVLVCLYRGQGDVVSTEDIVAEVWGERHVGENPVYKCIAKLRRALSDDAKVPSLIVTVPRMGYRLVVPPVETPPSLDRRRPDRQKLPAMKLLAPVAIGIVAGALIALAMVRQPAEEPVRIRPVSTFPGSHRQPSFSPDGQSIAFINETDGTPHVWVLDAGKQDARQLTDGAVGDARPRWSPDGAAILFTRSGSLWTVPSAGGDSREIVRDGNNPNWSWDGTRIVFERRFQIWIAAADGSDQRRVSDIVDRDLVLAPRWPAFSPDGSKLVYFDSDSTPLGDLWTVPVQGGAPVRLTHAPALGGAPVYMPDGNTVIYSSQRGGSRTLWRVDIATGNADGLLTGSGDDDFPDVARNGRQLVYSNSREHFTLLASDIATGTERTLHESRLSLLGPELSTDRQTLAYFGGASLGGFQLVTQPVSGAPATIVTTDPLATHALPQWSADGSALYFFHTMKSPAFSKLLLADGSIESVVDGWDWNVANGARVSPDGSAIIYSRLTGQSPVQTQIRSTATGKVSTFYATLEYPRWSADGSTVLGSKFVDQHFPGDVALCPLAGPPCVELAKRARVPVFSADETQVYFVRGFGVSQDLFVIPADGSSPARPVMTMAPLFRLGPFYSVTADGSIIWVRHQEERSEIWLTDLR